jgi:hypothetical protein
MNGLFKNDVLKFNFLILKHYSSTLTLKYHVAMNIKYKNFSCEEPTMIQLSIDRRCAIRAITLSSDRNPSFVSLELDRNERSSFRL